MTTGIAAILRHRDELKRRDPGAIVLYRVEDSWGDYYGAFTPDAVALIEILPRMEGVHYARGGTVGRLMIHPTVLDLVLARIAAAGKRAEVVERVAAEATKMTSERICPSCSECNPETPHHWMEDNCLTGLCCKHCPAIAVQCYACGGSGEGEEEDETGLGRDGVCGECGGAGIVEVVRAEVRDDLLAACRWARTLVRDNGDPGQAIDAAIARATPGADRR